MSAELPLLIVNPKSGRGISEQKWASMIAVIRNQFGSFECEFTGKQADAIRIAQEEAGRGRKLIIAMGGDGTISEVANGILRSGTDAELGILPGGTGGDFRRTLNVPSDLAAAARELKNAPSHSMDVGQIRFLNHDGNEETRYFINTASFGVSGRVARRANRSAKRLGGTVTYAAATVQTLFTSAYPEVTLQWDDQPLKRMKVVTVCIANGPSFGGGMKIAPQAKLNDGLFDMVVIGDMKTLRLLMSSYRLYSGSFLQMKNVALIHVKKVSTAPVHPEEEILMEVDGETPGRLPATIEILPGALRVRCQ